MIRTELAGVPAADRPSGPYPIGLMGLLATVAMLFASFTAAILVRRTGIDWDPVTLPPIVWLSTAILIGSSVFVERSRAAAGTAACADHLRIAAILGILFLAGQIVAWFGLARQGVFLDSNPHAAFFYMLSAIHGAHVLGGLGALAWTWKRAAGGAYTAGRAHGLLHTAIYWHFVGIVWLYLLVLLVTL
ncbi:MAG: heme-copper oxidase subunit III [Gemmatimonadales bacterium]